MRFTVVKSLDQVAIHTLHQTCAYVQHHHVAAANQLRGLPYQYGVVIPKSIRLLRKRVPEVLESSTLPGMMAELVQDLLVELRMLDERLKQYSERVE